jgi:hypothetical protein
MALGIGSLQKMANVKNPGMLKKFLAPMFEQLAQKFNCSLTDIDLVIGVNQKENGEPVTSEDISFVIKNKKTGEVIDIEKQKQKTE